MAMTDTQDDPEVALRRRIMNQYAGDVNGPQVDAPVDPTLAAPYTPPPPAATEAPAPPPPPTPAAPPPPPPTVTARSATAPAPTPSAPAPAAPASGGPSFDQVNADYQQYLGRPLSQNEYLQFWQNSRGYNPSMIFNSQEGLAFQNRNAQTNPAASPSSGDPVTDRIRSVFASQGKEATQVDLDYWKNYAARIGGDLGALEARMREPNTGGYTAPGSYDALHGLATVGGAGGGAAGGGGTFGGGSSLTSSASGTSGATPFDAGAMNALRALLMQRLGVLGNNDVSQDPQIVAAMQAAQDQTARQAAQERTQLAERLYAQGGGALNSQALTQQIQQSNEQNALGLSSLKAQLYTKAYEDRRAELQQDLAMAIQVGDAASARTLQQYIADLDASVRREGLGVQMAEFQQNQNAAANQSAF
jgi:hypothetical protein